MLSDFPNDVFAKKLAAIQERDPRSVTHALLVKEIEVTNGVIAHLQAPPSTEVRAQIRLFGQTYAGSTIKFGTILFESEKISDHRPTLNPATGELFFEAPLSQIAAYLAALRASKNIMLYYIESPYVDDAYAQIYTYDQL